MTRLFFSLLIFLPSLLPAQDTLNFIRYPDGSRTFDLQSARDTLRICLYPGGKKESQVPLRNYVESGIYTRWHENGRTMWEKEMRNGVADGKSTFYNEQGQRIAELRYANGIVEDTVFLKGGACFILGNISYTSRVVGGMEREDGSADVSEHSGMYRNCAMYVAKVDSLLKPVLIKRFKSDAYGDFMLTLPEGRYGFFPASRDIATIPPGQYQETLEHNMSGLANWDTPAPLVVIKNEGILRVKLHHASTGYAP